MVSCAVSDCIVTRRNNPEKYSFHGFPSNPLLRLKWLLIIKRVGWTPNKNSAICSKHFEVKCFIQRKGRRVLMKDSMPTLFVPVQFKRKQVTSYVNRSITPPPMEQSPGQVLTPRKTNLITKCSQLKKKIAAKNRVIRNLKAKTKRLISGILNLKTVLKELHNRPGLRDHKNDVQIACRNDLTENELTE